MRDVLPDQLLVCEREVAGAWVVFWCLVGVAAVFAAWLLFGSVVLGSTARGLAEVAVPPALREEVRLLQEADLMLEFFRNRWGRLELARERFGWSQAEFDTAMRLVEAAKGRFEAIEIARLGWGRDPRITLELLKRELELLHEQIVLTFCEEFQLPCPRGLAPDALPQPAARPPIRGRSFLTAPRAHDCRAPLCYIYQSSIRRIVETGSF